MTFRCGYWPAQQTRIYSSICQREPVVSVNLVGLQRLLLLFWLAVVLATTFSCASGSDSYQQIQTWNQEDDRPFEKRPENSIEYRLYSYLIGSKSSYLKTIRPVISHHDPIFVEVGMSVMMIEELVERDQIMVMAAAIKMKWTDAFLSWNPRQFGNLTWLAVSSSAIWVPDISIVNSPEPFAMTRKVTHVDVDFNGEVGFYPSGRLTTRCNLHITYFPFDHQHCEVFLESWIHPSNYLMIIPYKTYGATVDIKEYYTNHQWAITGFEVHMGSADYDGKNFSSITFVYLLKRKSQYYFMYFIFPQLLLSFLQTLSHTLPVEHPGRMAMLTSLFIGTSVTQAGVAVHIPKSSESTSLLQIYMLLSSCNLVIALVVTFFMMYAVLRYPNEEPSLIAIFVAFFSIVWPHKTEDNDSDKDPGDNESLQQYPTKRHQQRLSKSSNIKNLIYSTPTAHSVLSTAPSRPRPIQGFKYSGDDDEDDEDESPARKTTGSNETNSQLASPIYQPGFEVDYCYYDTAASSTCTFAKLGKSAKPSTRRPQSSLIPKQELFEMLDVTKTTRLSTNSGNNNNTYIDDALHNVTPIHHNSAHPKHRRKREVINSAASDDDNDAMTTGAMPYSSLLSSPNEYDDYTDRRRSVLSRMSSSFTDADGRRRRQKRGQHASVEDTRGLKRRWLLYCVAVDKTIMYANAAWNIILPVVLFGLVPIIGSMSPEGDDDTAGS